MRLALLSDIHGIIAGPEAAFAYPAILFRLPVALFADGPAVLHHRMIGDGRQLAGSVAGKTLHLPGIIDRNVRRRSERGGGRWGSEQARCSGGWRRDRAARRRDWRT